VDEGFIKIHRKILRWEWYTDFPVKVLFLHCLILANHKPKNWRGITVIRGQFISSVGKLAKQTGLTVKQIRLALKKLEKTNEITVEATNRFSLITVNEYSTYHVNEREEGKQKGKQEGKQKANEGQTEGKQRATTKNVKNVKNVKKEKKKKEEADLIFPDCVEKSLIEKYFENRVEIKKKMTHNAKELFLKRVQTFHDEGQDVEDLIKKAIIGNWSNIFREKGSNGKKENYRGVKQKPVEKAKSKSESGYISGRPTTYTFKD
jgi:hypothetical protein